MSHLETPVNTGNNADLAEGAARGAAVVRGNCDLAVEWIDRDARLLDLLDAWRTLPDDLRTAVVLFVKKVRRGGQ